MKPLAQQHLERARRNFAAYQRLRDGGADLDWAIVALFYTALHLVQAYFVESATSGFDIPRDHEQRRDRILLKLLPIFHDYRRLQTASHDLRYDPDCAPPSIDEVRRLEEQPMARIGAELRARGITLEP